VRSQELKRRYDVIRLYSPADPKASKAAYLNTSHERLKELMPPTARLSLLTVTLCALALVHAYATTSSGA